MQAEVSLSLAFQTGIVKERFLSGADRRAPQSKIYPSRGTDQLQLFISHTSDFGSTGSHVVDATSFNCCN